VRAIVDAALTICRSAGVDERWTLVRHNDIRHLEGDPWPTTRTV
jgi:hypothetical protein